MLTIGVVAENDVTLLKEQANIKTSIGQCTAQLADIEEVRCFTQHDVMLLCDDGLMEGM